jgi:hypothetical protein
MFPPPETTLSARFRRGLERAIEFATLGEYGVAEAQQEPRRRFVPPPPPAWSAERSAAAVGPATAAARRTLAPRRNEPPKRVPARAALRDLGLRPGGVASPRRRTRVGQPAPRPQPCTTPLPR